MHGGCSVKNLLLPQYHSEFPSYPQGQGLECEDLALDEPASGH